MNLLEKLKEFLKSKPPIDDYIPPDGPPNPDRDTMREMETPQEKRTSWLKYKIKF